MADLPRPLKTQAKTITRMPGGRWPRLASVLTKDQRCKDKITEHAALSACLPSIADNVAQKCLPKADPPLLSLQPQR